MVSIMGFLLCGCVFFSGFHCSTFSRVRGLLRGRRARGSGHGVRGVVLGSARVCRVWPRARGKRNVVVAGVDEGVWVV